MRVYANQGYREAAVLIENFEGKSLIEYEMPNGTTALRITPEGDYDSRFYKTVAYKSIPRKWLRELVINGQDWAGCPQQSGKPLPSPEEMWVQRYGKLPDGEQAEEN